MKRPIILLLLLFAIVFGGQIAALHQINPDQAPAPTLVPPTPIPQQETGELEILPSESAVGRIQADGVLRVGILYNAPPFGELNIRGEVSGYDADLARSIAETWDVDVEFVQVTRQPERSVNLLRSGQIDMLIAAQVHRRELDALVEFSQTYYMGHQSIMVLAEDEATTPTDMDGRTLGVVIATSAESAVSRWLNRSELSVPVQSYLTLDRAYIALVSGEIDGIVDSAYRLRQVALQRPDLTRILEEPIEMEPFAIAVLRQDVNTRNLVNRTLQYLTATERMDEIHQTYFPGAIYNLIQVWENLSEEPPKPEQYPTTLSFPAEYIVPRILSNRVVRVAGLIGLTAESDAPESQRRLDAFHRALVQEMASRWGATVEFIPNSLGNAAELVANGEADIAVGLVPDWELSEQIDFTGSYLLHGERLMVRDDDNITGFRDLGGGRVVVTPNNEQTAASRAVEIAETVNSRIEIEQQREQDLAYVLLIDDEINASAVFGDSLKLAPHVLAHPGELRLTLTDTGNPRWYSQSYLSLGVPRNDIDFRLLVEYTLQEMARDGTLNQLLQPIMLSEEIPGFQIWPGSSTYLVFDLAAR